MGVRDIPVEAVAVLKQKYPGFDKPLWSKCRHHDKYGIDLSKEARKAIAEIDPQILPKKRDARSKERSNRLTCRTSSGVFEALQRTVETHDGWTMQDVLEKALIKYLEDENAVQNACMDCDAE